jgi:hypothetical protein
MRNIFALIAVSLAALTGCVPTVGNTLDWQEKSFRKVTTNVPRYGDDRLAFASQVDANGLLKEAVIQQYAIVVRDFPEQATVSLRCLSDFRAAVWFRGFDPGKLKVTAATLIDNRGNTFTLRQARKPSYGCAAELLVDRKQNANWLEFNNREYFLTLTVEFTHDGQRMTAVFPKICCVFDKRAGT